MLLKCIFVPIGYLTKGGQMKNATANPVLDTPLARHRLSWNHCCEATLDTSRMIVYPKPGD